MSQLVFFQIIIYLVISPLWLCLLRADQSFRSDIALIVLFSFLAGQYFANSDSKVTKVSCMPYVIPSIIKIGMGIFSLLYVYLVIRAGLIDRRQGSEQMALVYSQLSVIDLVLMRIYEEIFYPFIILLLLQPLSSVKKIPWWLLFSLVLAFVFSGAIYSRAKLLMPAAFYLIFFYFPGRRTSEIKRGTVKAFLGFIIISVCFVVIYRAAHFDDVERYLVADFLTRLDGLELISLLDQHLSVPFFGTHDLLIFVNFVTAIPFLDGVAALKQAGLTSSKSYLLKIVLNRNQIDINNTFATDLYYFGGYPLLSLGAACYGYFCRKFDVGVSGGGWLYSRAKMALMTSFAINAVRIEQDFFGIIVSIIRDFGIFYLFFYLILFRAQRFSPQPL